MVLTGQVYADSCECIRACTRDDILMKHGVTFGHIIHLTNPPCIDCRWPPEHDTEVRARLLALRASYRPSVVPKKTYTVSYKETGHHELQLDCIKSQCKVTHVECTKIHTGVWRATLHGCCQRRNRRALYGLDLWGKNMTRIEIKCGQICWARNLAATDHVQVDRPGNMCWPLWVTFYDSTYLVIHGSTRPTDLQVLEFDVGEYKGHAYEHGILTAYDFACEDAEPKGAIARFQSGLTGVLTTDDKEVVHDVAERLKREASEENGKMDTDKVSTYEVTEG